MAATTLVVIGKVSSEQLKLIKRKLKEEQGVVVKRVVRVRSAWLFSSNDYDERDGTEQFVLDHSKIAAKFGVTEYELNADHGMALELVRDFIASSTGLNLISDLAGVVYLEAEHPQAEFPMIDIFRCSMHKIHPV